VPLRLPRDRIPRWLNRRQRAFLSSQRNATAQVQPVQVGASLGLGWRIQARAVGGISMGRAPLARRPVGATLVLSWLIWDVDLALLAELDADLAEVRLIEQLNRWAV